MIILSKGRKNNSGSHCLESGFQLTVESLFLLWFRVATLCDLALLSKPVNQL